MRDPAAEFFASYIRLTMLPLRLGVMAAEAMLRVRPPATETASPSELQMRAVREDQVDAAADTIALALMSGRDLGLAIMIRTNSPVQVIREIARAALEAARDVE